MDLGSSCLVFPYSRVNGNAISALLASLDIHTTLRALTVFLPPLKQPPIQLTEQLKPFSKIILAFSAYSTQIDEIKTLIEEYKEVYGSRLHLIILGGPHAVGSPKSALDHGADIVCTGEGEVVFPLILQTVLQLETIDYNKHFSHIHGIAFVQNGELVRTGKATLVDLDDFPPFSVKHGLIRPIEISRGCGWNCRFCQTRSRGVPVRHRSVRKILEYVGETMKYFNKRRPDIRFVSPNALSYGSEDGISVNLEKVRELLQGVRDLIGEEGKIYFGSFPSEVRPETITVTSVELLKKYSDAKRIIVGGQSGSDRILNEIERGHSSSETLRAVNLLIDANFAVEVDIIFGLPGETKEDIQLTKKHIEQLNSMGAIIHSHTFMPLVGTPLSNHPPGIISDDLRQFVVQLQTEGKLYGSHNKQERLAKHLSSKRKEELDRR